MEHPFHSPDGRKNNLFDPRTFLYIVNLHSHNIQQENNWTKQTIAFGLITTRHSSAQC